MDTMLPSAGAYKVSAQVNGIPLDECSFTGPRDLIRPYFEESVSGDPDITGLAMYLRNSGGDIIGWKVIYTIDPDYITDDGEPNVPAQGKDNNQKEDEKDESEEDTEDTDAGLKTAKEEPKPVTFKNGEEFIIPVKNLDNKMPYFPMPPNLPMGRYVIVYQIMSGKDVLQRTEKNIYCLGETVFSYEGINANLPGVTESRQLVPRETVVMLEAEIEYDRRLDPYIVWYEGRKKIGEGKISQGAGSVFWKTPDQNGFYSLSAEIYPVSNYDGLTGYKKEISLLVSSKAADIHLVSGDNNALVQRYIFDGNLNNLKGETPAEFTLGTTAAKWMSANGTYGLATGSGNVFKPANVLISGEGKWQLIFRLKVINNGGILSVKFGHSYDVSLHLYIKDEMFVLTLESAAETSSRLINLPETFAASGRDSFITAGINFSIMKDSLSAQLNIIDSVISGESEETSVSVKSEIKNDFSVVLGFYPPVNDSKKDIEPDFNVLWDEFAVYCDPHIETLAEDIKPAVTDEMPETGDYSAY